MNRARAPKSFDQDASGFERLTPPELEQACVDFCGDDPPPPAGLRRKVAELIRRGKGIRQVIAGLASMKADGIRPDEYDRLGHYTQRVLNRQEAGKDDGGKAKRKRIPVAERVAAEGRTE